MTEDIKRKIKFDELSKRYKSVEEEHHLLQEKLYRAQRSIKRLRLERSILLNRIDQKNQSENHNSDSDTSSDLSLHNNDYKHVKSLLKLNRKQHHHFEKHKPESNNNAAIATTTVIKPPRKKKDPNAPKGPGNVFFLFSRMERDKIKDENPDENISDVTKLLGLKWKAMSKEEKQVYYDTYKKEMDEYEEAMKVYKSNGGGGADNQRSQSIDPMDSAIAESSVSSPIITSPDSTAMDHQHVHHDIIDDYQNNNGHATSNKDDDHHDDIVMESQAHFHHRPVVINSNYTAPVVHGQLPHI